MNQINYLFAGYDNSRQRIQLMKILIEYKYGNDKTTEEVTEIIMNHMDCVYNQNKQRGKNNE